MQVSDEHLRGRSVIAADGQAIGEVAALFIDTSGWTIIGLQIKLSKPVAEQIGATRASSTLPHLIYLSAWSSR